MNPRLLDLALKKQRLQIRSATLRQDLSSGVAATAPVFSAIDGIRASIGWAQRHMTLLAAAGVALLVARPRFALRWAKHGFLAYRFWRMLHKAP